MPIRVNSLDNENKTRKVGPYCFIKGDVQKWRGEFFLTFHPSFLHVTAFYYNSSSPLKDGDVIFGQYIMSVILELFGIWITTCLRVLMSTYWQLYASGNKSGGQEGQVTIVRVGMQIGTKDHHYLGKYWVSKHWTRGFHKCRYQFKPYCTSGSVFMWLCQHNIKQQKKMTMKP